MKQIILNFLFAIFVALIVDALVSWAAMLLWNDVIVTYFKLPSINFWHMFEILILADLLFKKNINVKNN